MVRYRFPKTQTIAAPILQHKPLNTIPKIMTQVIPIAEEPKDKPIRVVFRDGKRIEVYKYKL